MLVNAGTKYTVCMSVSVPGTSEYNKSPYELNQAEIFKGQKLDVQLFVQHGRRCFTHQLKKGRMCVRARAQVGACTRER